MFDEDTIISMGAVTQRLRGIAQDSLRRILVVDDDELARGVIAERLLTRGFEVLQAANGQEALVQLADAPIPVVLVDCQMPVMDGLELTARLRESGFDETYIIMLTGRDGSFDYEKGYLAGVDDYLSKKVREVELMARITAGLNTYLLRHALNEARASLRAAK